MEEANFILIPAEIFGLSHIPSKGYEPVYTYIFITYIWSFQAVISSELYL